MSKADDTPRAKGADDQAAEGSVNGESRADQERREANELLAGFDRPGRGPRRSVPQPKDFVDYYASGKAKGAGDDGKAVTPRRPSSSPELAAPGPMRSEAPTYILPRERARRSPGWLGWAAATLLLVVIGTGVAYFATMDEGATARGGADPATGPSAPSAATTITSSTTPPSATARDDIPPPVDVSGDTTASATASGVTVTAPSTTSAAGSAGSAGSAAARPRASATASPATTAASPSPSPSPSPSSSTTPRDDLIREMH